jgi:hypothetical protein
LTLNHTHLWCSIFADVKEAATEGDDDDDEDNVHGEGVDTRAVKDLQ